MYIYTILTFLLFLGWAEFFENTKVNLKLSGLYTNSFIKINFFLFLASLVGIPPLFGFFTKFMIFFNLVFLKNYLIFIFLLIFNAFLLVFYLNQIRFLQSNFKKKIFIINRNKFNLFVLSFVITAQFVNITALVLIPFFFKFIFI
jgi:NADH:ubiquinone oxidoreductase subunit 2 (subunit N)